MAALNFKDQETILLSSWLNGVNQLVYRIFLDPDTIDDVVLLLPKATQERKGLINGPDQEKVNDIDSAFRVAELEVESITASRSLDNNDAYKFFRVNNASEVTITVPPAGSTSFSIGEYAYFEKQGAGNITFSAGPGVLVNATTPLTVSAQNLVVGLIKVAVNTWVLFGNRQASEGLLAFGIFDAPGVGVYRTSDFSRLPNPTTQPDTGVEGIQINPAGTEILSLGVDSGQNRYALPAMTDVTDYPDLTDNGGGVAFSADGSIAMMGSGIYNTTTQLKTNTIAIPGLTLVNSGSFNPAGTLLAAGFSGGDTNFRVYNTSDYTIAFDGTALGLFVTDLEFSPDGTILAVTNGASIRFYNVSDWSLANTITGIDFLVNGISYNPDGSLIAAAHDDTPYITVFNTTTLAALPSPSVLPPFAAFDVDFNSDGSLLAVGHDDSPFITIYNTSDYSKLPNPSSLPTDRVQSVDFFP